jgi:hypothetical protein
MTVAHQSPDFELMPDLLCGRSYRNAESEAHASAMREGEQTPFAGCGKPLRWVYAYRCRQCGRWLHGPCMDRHFGAERDAEINRLREGLADALETLRPFERQSLPGYDAASKRRVSITVREGDLCQAWQVLTQGRRWRAALGVGNPGRSAVSDTQEVGT